MKTKTLVILLVILGVLAGTGTLLIYSRDMRSPSGAMGAPLLKGLPANDIASIVIQTSNTAVCLEKKADSWIVKERFNYPADFSKISDLVRTLKEVKVGRKFEASEKVLKRLSLKSPDDANALEEERGTRIRMTDSKGKTLLDMALGKTRIRDQRKGPPDGQYVMVGNGREIYLIDKILSSFASGPAEWLEKSPVHVDAEEIRQITCFGPGSTGVRYRLARPAMGKDFALIEPSISRNIKKSSLNRLSNALSSLEIKDVATASASPASMGEGASSQLDYLLFDGRVYHVTVQKACSATVPCQIRFGVAYQRPEPAKQEAKSGDATEKRSPAEAKSEEALAAEATEENERLKPWVFTIPEWQHKAFFADLEQLLEKKTEKKGADSTPVK
ncbi:MAG: DUF4340 domain-containing protein [Deltaproteobacteria bacterium]|nr:DUF4340 domain-containing protein [Deltaproteobacteria bacterium]